MNDLGNSKLKRARRSAAGKFLVAVVCLSSLATAAVAQEEPGFFEVRSANAVLSGGVYYLDARMYLQLSTEAIEALESGLPMRIRLEIELLTWRRLWMDTEAAGLTQLYELSYHALTRRYIVKSLNSGDQRSFAALTSALVSLGRIEELPIIDRSLLDENRRYDIRIRALLDTEQLPGPLRLIAFWRRDWSLRSDWYRWTLQEE